MVAIYDEDLSDSPRDPVTLIFPGDQAGSSPKRVVPDRVGTRTLIFKTPGTAMPCIGILWKLGV